MTSSGFNKSSSHRASFQNSFTKRRLSELNQTVSRELLAELPKTHDSQVATVLTILKEANEKLKISLILPQIFENPKTLQKYVKGTKYEDCWKMVMKHREQRKHESLESPTKLQLLEILDYFHANHKILQVLPTWLEDIGNDEKLILESFAMLWEIAQERFTRKASAQLANEKHLHEVYLANERVKKDIKDIILQIQNRKIHENWKFAAKTGVIKALEDEVAFREQHHNMCVTMEMTKTNREVRKLSLAFATIKKDLDEELEKARFNYEKELQKNLKQEKKARDEKNKYQLQLQALINKYDETMLDKYNEETYLNEECDKLQLEFDEFMIDYNQEYALYDQYVLQKERAYKQEHEAKIRQFFDNLAAQRIQRWWRRCKREEKQERDAMGKMVIRKGKSGGGAAKDSKEINKKRSVDKGVKAKPGFKGKNK